MHKRYIVTLLFITGALCTHISWRDSYAMEGEVDVRGEGAESGEVDLSKEGSDISPEIQQQQSGLDGNGDVPSGSSTAPVSPTGDSSGTTQPSQGGTSGFSSGDTKAPQDDSTDTSGADSEEELTVPEEIAGMEESDDYRQSRVWPSGQSPNEIKLAAFVSQIDERNATYYNEQIAQKEAAAIVPDLKMAASQEAELVAQLIKALDAKNKIVFDQIAVSYFRFAHAWATLTSYDAVTSEIQILQKKIQEDELE